LKQYGELGIGLKFNRLSKRAKNGGRQDYGWLAK